MEENQVPTEKQERAGLNAPIIHTGQCPTCKILYTCFGTTPQFCGNCNEQLVTPTQVDMRDENVTTFHSPTFWYMCPNCPEVFELNTLSANHACTSCGASLGPCAPSSSIDHPTHYNWFSIECIDVIEHFNFNLGNAIKYVWRAGYKSARKLEDLEKAAWYIRREIERLSDD